MSWERPEIVAATGRHVLVKERDSGKYAVGDLEEFYESNVIHTFTAPAAALWGNKVWKPATETGTVAAYDEEDREDRRRRRHRFRLQAHSAPGGRALDLLGVRGHEGRGLRPEPRQERQRPGRRGAPPRRRLRRPGHRGRPDGHGLLPQRRDQVTTTLLASGVEWGHGIGWAVDPFGGNVAHVDADQRIHVTEVPVPRSPVTSIESRVEQNFVRAGGKEPWTGHWQLSRPADAWKVTFTDITKKTVATISGTARAAASISATWDGLATGGRKPQNGAHTWTVSVRAAGESSYVPVKTGTVQVSGGTAAYRDEQADGRGNVLTVNKSGTLTSHDFPATGVHDKWGRAAGTSSTPTCPSAT
ncbi:hypothetical protein NQP46_17725 [Streptomyces albus]|nr:hypothetical protein NQP46_17725 [Streptomyces albus]